MVGGLEGYFLLLRKKIIKKTSNIEYIYIYRTQTKTIPTLQPPTFQIFFTIETIKFFTTTETYYHYAVNGRGGGVSQSRKFNPPPSRPPTFLETYIKKELKEIPQ